MRTDPQANMLNILVRARDEQNRWLWNWVHRCWKRITGGQSVDRPQRSNDRSEPGLPVSG